MAIQYSVTVRNAKLDAVETAIGTSAILRFYTGGMPANCAAARTGTVLATLNLPSDWMAAASGGSKVKSGTWTDASADASGVVGYFSILDSGGTTCHIQGTVTITGGGGNMEIDSVNFTAGQSVTVTTFTINAGNA